MLAAKFWNAGAINNLGSGWGGIYEDLLMKSPLGTVCLQGKGDLLPFTTGFAEHVYFYQLR